VVVVDVQNDFCHPDGVVACAGSTVDGIELVYANINRLPAAAPTSGSPVIRVCKEWTDDLAAGLLASRSTFLASEGLRAGTRGAELVRELGVAAGDFPALHDHSLRLMATVFAEVVSTSEAVEWVTSSSLTGGS
jgi:nicotinamidase-related amidase